MNVLNFTGRLLTSLRKTRSEIIEQSKNSRKNKTAVFNYFQQNDQRKLDLGATDARDGFLTADIGQNANLTFDFTKKFPLPDNSFDFVYCSHVLEHFFYVELIHVLQEVRRILKNGGTFSMCVPNARLFITSYFSSDPFDVQKNCSYKPALHYHSKIDVINYMAYMDGNHRMMYDEENLAKILQSTGFKNVALRQFEAGLDLPERLHESLYLKCSK
jgi:predicted SAM-dependent methyltransferase